MYIYRYIYIYVYLYTCMYMYMYIYICIYITRCHFIYPYVHEQFWKMGPKRLFNISIHKKISGRGPARFNTFCVVSGTARDAFCRFTAPGLNSFGPIFRLQNKRTVERF